MAHLPHLLQWQAGAADLRRSARAELRQHLASFSSAGLCSQANSHDSRGLHFQCTADRRHHSRPCLKLLGRPFCRGRPPRCVQVPAPLLLPVASSPARLSPRLLRWGTCPGCCAGGGHWRAAAACLGPWRWACPAGAVHAGRWSVPCAAGAGSYGWGRGQGRAAGPSAAAVHRRCCHCRCTLQSRPAFLGLQQQLLLLCAAA
jgi:hypothetical protein